MRVRRMHKPILIIVFLAALQFTPSESQEFTLGHERAPARTNWAVSLFGTRIYTFYGLSKGKTFRNITRDVHMFDTATNKWAYVGSVPVTEGRLASSAVTIADVLYLIGGYTVSPQGHERSAPEVLGFDPRSNKFWRETSIPIPVDDTVALPWRDRWIVLVSGWHDTGNVADVQLYDTVRKRWIPGTPWPGTPVFGHSGGIVDDDMVICDGVTATRDQHGKGQFRMSDACWQGHIDWHCPGQIGWTMLTPHPGRPLYRAGASGFSTSRLPSSVVFAGGSEIPYNYNGIGYDEQPSQPTDAVYTFSLQQHSWSIHAPLPIAGMDFRGLVTIAPVLYLVGGMREQQRVGAGVIRLALP
jgi:hypothetical protein